MAKINGTLLLVYVNGTVIAAQSSVTLNVSQELFDASTKDSGGWTEHGNGQRAFDISIDGLASTTGLSDSELVEFINDRKDLLVVIEGGLDSSYVMKASMASVSLTGPSEEALTITGSITGNGSPALIEANTVTTLGASDTYSTFTTLGTAVTSAINTSGTNTADSNDISIVNGKRYGVFTFLTKTSGQLPTIGLYGGSTDISNRVTMIEGANFITLTATSDATGTLRIRNTAAANFSLSHTYVWELIT